MVININRLREITVDTLWTIHNVIVVGDLHGDMVSLQAIREHFNPDEDLMIFLGDYADRGPQGVDVIAKIDHWVKRYPSHVYALKGNHEDYTEDGSPLFTPWTLRDEVISKKGDWMNYFRYYLRPFIDKLHLAVIIPDVALFVHGGVSTRIQALNDLKFPKRAVEVDVLWSDPFQGMGERFNRRGVGVEFGEDISHIVCDRLGVSRIVRSHQPRKASCIPHVTHGGRVITISSTSVSGGIPFILKLPAGDLGTSFNALQDTVQLLVS